MPEPRTRRRGAPKRIARRLPSALPFAYNEVRLAVHYWHWTTPSFAAKLGV